MTIAERYVAHKGDETMPYRIGDVQFETRDEAEAWVEAGNIGGTYSIIRTDWCATCEAWVDNMADVCDHCGATWHEETQIYKWGNKAKWQARKQALAKLAAWNEWAVRA